MTATKELPESKINAGPSDEYPALRVSIIYEDIESGERAKGCLDRIARSLNLEADAFALRLWSHDLLAETAVRSAAAHEARDYDIVLISMRYGREPSSVLQTWISEWLKCRCDQPCALAVMLNGEAQNASAASPLLSYLADIANSGGLDLVFPAGEAPPPPAEEPNIRQIARNAINASPLLDGILDDWESFSHWGINE